LLYVIPSPPQTGEPILGQASSLLQEIKEIEIKRKKNITFIK
jgi:hypothetical protein